MKVAYADLGGHLAKGLAPVYVVTGTEEFLRELALKEIEAATLGREPSPEEGLDFNRERFDGREAGVTTASILLSVNQLPMMGDRRLVLVRRAKRFIEIQRKSTANEEPETAPDVQAMVDYVKDPAPRTVLLLDLEEEPDGRRKPWKEIEAHAVVVACDPLKAWEMERWIARRCDEMNLRLAPEVTRYLAAELGSEQRRVVAELEKIALYSGGAPVSLEEVMVLMGRGRAGHIFRFTDLVGTRRAEPALRQLGRLLDEGESPFPILALLDRKLGQLLVAKEWQLSARRVKGPGLASVLRIPPRAAEETARQANGFEEGELVEAMKGLYQLDRTIKSTGLPARLLLERWILQVCRSPGPARRGFVRDKF